MPAETVPEHADRQHADRQAWMAVLARAATTDMMRLLEDAPDLPPHSRLRGPECGLVMVRGRIGGGGGAFNLGEMAVTRCSVRLEDGTVGHAYVAGRDLGQAELAARLDAALQDATRRPALARLVIAPLAAAQLAARTATASRAAATQVQFFTMATMRK
jgi:alpha-D-ribose 1-methylphosphonate 5-triphosphate synthase subunit PhnG